mmetsp:Transcript_31091/g.47474  ORF Transcript_31091/g.47474 Transcript_31091/m.47474 type:complete len:108 (-) Transcript_31091:419-742(-)
MLSAFHNTERKPHDKKIIISDDSSSGYRQANSDKNPHIVLNFLNDQESNSSESCSSSGHFQLLSHKRLKSPGLRQSSKVLTPQSEKRKVIMEDMGFNLSFKHKPPTS